MIEEIALRLPLGLLATGAILGIIVGQKSLSRRPAYIVQSALIVGTIVAGFAIDFDVGSDDSRLFYIVAAVIFGIIGAVFIAVIAAVRERMA